MEKPASWKVENYVLQEKNELQIAQCYPFPCLYIHSKEKI